MQDKVKATLDKIVESFKNNSIPKAIAYRTFPPLNIPCNQWSFLNQMIVFFNETQDARGFRQWNRVNRFVKKGSKSFFILSPLIKSNDDESKLLGFKATPVFRYEDTDGENLEYEKLELPELPLLDKAKKWGINIKVLGGQSNFHGYFSAQRQEIGLATPEEKTFFHELSHYAHSKLKTLKGGQDPWQEIVAELSAQSLCQIIGKSLDSQLGNSYEYIDYYSRKLKISPYNAIIKVISEVGQVINYILE